MSDAREGEREGEERCSETVGQVVRRETKEIYKEGRKRIDRVQHGDSFSFHFPSK